MLATNARETKSERLCQVAELAESRLKGQEQADFAIFLERFYERVLPGDLADSPVESLYGAALAIWKFGETRLPGQVRVRAYNPHIEEHGWRSPHTILEVINDDMPFIVDSVVGALGELGHEVHLLIHPVVHVARSESGQRTGIGRGSGEGRIAESVLHVQIDAHSDAAVLARIEADIADVLADVRAAVEDWHLMLQQLDEAIEELHAPIPLEAEEIEETRAFLEWMRDNHFTFIGSRMYVYRERQDGGVAEVIEDSGRGILRDPNRKMLRGAGGRSDMTPMVREFFNRPEVVQITKTSARGTVHRPIHMDYVGVKRFDAKGELIGERRFVGLFTSAAYSRTPRDIPLLRRKIAQVLSMAGIAPFSHDGKTLIHILDTYPRDELFQIEVETLHDIAIGILGLQERPQIRLFARRDKFERFYSCIVYVPRERMNSELHRRFSEILVQAFDGRLSNFYTQVSDSPLARLHYIIGTDPRPEPRQVEYERIEEMLVRAARTWGDDLSDALREKWGEEHGKALAEVYTSAFPAAYAEAFNVERALGDIEHIEALDRADGFGLNFYRVIEDGEHEVRLKIYHPDDSVPLTDCLKMLEHMGFRVIDEVPYQVRLDETQSVWLQDFFMRSGANGAIDLAALKAKLEEAFERTWRGDLEDDGFNRLVVSAGLQWREVAVIRALCKYLRQTGVAFSESYMISALDENPEIVRRLVALFHARFDPAFEGKRAVATATLADEIEQALDQVVSLDQDRILRRYLNLMQAMVRSNFFQKAADGGPKPYISFKFDSLKIAELPKPRPFREIFVYSPRVEAVHLRGGKVARGGIRWSDRREDFRTEVLGLMKAQMVKNAVIVPVGSKGGFYPKQLPVGGDREAVQAEVIESYRTFMRGMLDITDNLVAGKPVPPAEVVRYDDDDPYLVVAADKGTATFSDIANELAQEYGFWLGDAFASGGRTGYDHKAMAITARGAWESVKRHFRELGRDIQSEPFTVIGIGDMSGDVFGNGMLLSEQIRLLAAFDHRDVFIDPDPDPAKSHAERRRLFELPRSSWADYDASLISKGGGVFSRAAKSVALTPEIKALSGLEQEHVTPAELINALLKAETDLLWFGGIGTYVKSSEESHAEVGDRANDALRVNGDELRCKVIGEGGNLGCTQLGRIEFARLGGRLNTDAIDNSAGVDCSDHEVNIKILLGHLVAEGEMTEKQRNRLLADMTEEVGVLVLRNNYLQSQALSLLEAQAGTLLDQQVRFMRALERAGQLDREIEFLPDDEEIEVRRIEDAGFTRPELSVLMAYAKMTLYQQFLETDLTDSEYLLNDVIKYFPRPLRRKYRKAALRHQLRGEIIATVTANSIVNRAGFTFVHDVVEETGESLSAVARAYAVSRDAFGLRALWGQIELLDNKVPAAQQTEMLLAIADLLRHGTLWFLHNRPRPLPIAATLDEVTPGIKELTKELPKIAGPDEAANVKRKAAQFRGFGLERAMAQRLACLELMVSALDIVQVANDTDRSVGDVGRVYFQLGEELDLEWLRQQAETLASSDYWEQSAVATIIDDLYGQQRALTAQVLALADGATTATAVAEWCKLNAAAVTRSRALIEDFKQSDGIDVARLAVANRMVRRMIAG